MQKLAELRAKVSYQGTVSVVVCLVQYQSIYQMTEKRSRKAEEEALEHKANENLRRKAGKVGLLWITSFVTESVTDHSVKGHEQNQGRFESEAGYEGSRTEEKRFLSIIVFPHALS